MKNDKYVECDVCKSVTGIDYAEGNFSVVDGKELCFNCLAKHETNKKQSACSHKFTYNYFNGLTSCDICGMKHYDFVKQELAELKRHLKEIEWGTETICSACNGREWEGHEEDCWLNLALEDEQTPSVNSSDYHAIVVELQNKNSQQMAQKYINQLKSALKEEP